MSRVLQRPTIWIVGDWQHADFAEAVRWLSERTHLLPLPLGESRREGPDPDAILFCQSRPGQLSPAAVERLHAQAPLARLVALVGNWCEGELRSGQPWPGVVRVPWKSWPVRLPLALDLQSQLVRQPRTLTEAERLQREIAALRVPEHRGREVSAALRTACRTTFDCLYDALAILHVRAIWLTPGKPAAVGCALELIDGWDNQVSPAGSPQVMLLHFPRPDDWARAAELGVSAVVPLPLLLAEFAAVLKRLVVPQALEAAERRPAVA